MKKYLKVTSLVLLAVAFLGSASIVTARIQKQPKAVTKKETQKVQKRVLPVLVFSGVQLVLKIFATENHNQSISIFNKRAAFPAAFLLQYLPKEDVGRVFDIFQG